LTRKNRTRSNHPTLHVTSRRRPLPYIKFVAQRTIVTSELAQNDALAVMAFPGLLARAMIYRTDLIRRKAPRRTLLTPPPVSRTINT
jgi:hypothetical protein